MKAAWRAAGLMLAGAVLGFAAGRWWAGRGVRGDRTDRTDRTDLSDPSDPSDRSDLRAPPAAAAAARAAGRSDITRAVPAVGLDRATVRRLVDDYQRVPDPAARLALVGRLFEDWARTEPEAAAAFAVRIEGDLRGAALRGALDAWLEADPDAARDWVLESRPWGWPPAGAVLVSLLFDRDPAQAREFVLSLPARSDKSEAVAQLVLRMVSEDPGGAARWIERLESVSLRSSALRALAREWPRVDLEGAEAYLLELRPGPARGDLLGALCRERAKADPLAALGWLRGRGDLSAGELHLGIGEVMRSWAREAPEAAGAYYLEHYGELPDSVTADELAGSIAQRDPRQALAFIDALPAELKVDRRMQMHGILQSLAETAPEEAALLFAEMRPNASGPEAVEIGRMLAGTWARSDLEGALAWHERTADPELRQAILSGISWYWSEADPEGMDEYVRGMEPGVLQKELILSLAYSKARDDPQRALAWALSLPNEGARASAIVPAMRVWAEASAADAMAYVGRMPEGKARGEAAVAVAPQIARREDPVDALRFLYKYGAEGEQFDDVTGEIVAQWCQRDAGAARAWVEGLPQGRERDYSVRAYIFSATGLSPSQMCDLGATIESESVRRWPLEHALRNWALADQPSALAWLEKAALPERERQDLRRALE